jgi:para-nitrobenzyl esterase
VTTRRSELANRRAVVHRCFRSKRRSGYSRRVPAFEVREMANQMTRSKLLLAATAIVLAGGVGLRGQPTTVRIDAGLVSGVAGGTSKMRVFKGIPFAAPPVGRLRWRPPQPVHSWNGVRRADQFSARCVQPGEAAVGRQGLTAVTAPPMSEDCLYLNVWTEAASASERRPVIVWSHGGAFTIGTGSARDGEALARKGTVVVAYNYRSGPFGFFSHPELSRESGRNASGNYGLMDLLTVLRWVQQNITIFGGDPNRVTLVGQSGGGRLTRALVASAHGKALFHRAISQSAPVRIERMWTLAEAEKAGQAEAAKVGAASLAALRAQPADEIQRGMQTGRLVVDGHYMTEDISITIAEGRHNQVDLLVGSNKDEATFVSLYPASPFFGLEKTTAQQFTDEVRRRFGSRASVFLDLYPAGLSDDQARASQRAAFRDEAAWNAREWARAQTRAGSNAYLYYFVHEPPVAPGQTNRGATHGAEIAYVFNNPVALWTDVDRALADAVSSYWVNFAANGNPNGTGLPVWPAFQPNANERLILGPKIELGPGLDAGRVDLFDAVAIRRSVGLDAR